VVDYQDFRGTLAGSSFRPRHFQGREDARALGFGGLGDGAGIAAAIGASAAARQREEPFFHGGRRYIPCRK